jgi:hypothetical protein
LCPQLSGGLSVAREGLRVLGCQKPGQDKSSDPGGGSEEGLAA